MRALVLELVEGPTLAERIAQGPIPVEETLRIALEIAQALEAAHEKGIIHRDLKPANVKITPEESVKVLDFGLAKAFETELAEQELASSPTLTMEATQEGMILGTAAYMSPEQARGRVVDKRTDIWSFGMLLVEMLTGKGMYAGESLTETIAAVIHQEPDLEGLPKDTPWKLRGLMERCLRKDPRMRLRDMGDARIEIEEVLADPDATLQVPGHASEPMSWRRMIPWVTAALTVGALIGSMIVWLLIPPSEGRPAQLSIVPPQTAPLQTSLFVPDIAISPNGIHVVYVAGAEGGTQLYLRPVNQLGAIPIPGTERGSHPFFSPDSSEIGFVAGNQLKRVSIHGGRSTTICTVPGGGLRGATWGENGTIILGSYRTGLFRVEETGGEPTALTTPDTEGQTVHRWPEFLPGNKAVLCNSGSGFEWQIAVFDLGTAKLEPLGLSGGNPHYAPTGHIVYGEEGLWAAPFDLDSLELTGESVRVLEDAGAKIVGGVDFGFSAEGSLVYVPLRARSQGTVVWVDRQGQEKEWVNVGKGSYLRPRLSPNDQRLAVYDEDDQNIWILEVDQERKIRLTSEGNNTDKVWSPDGRRIAFSSNKDGPRNIYWRPSDGSGKVERLTTSANVQSPDSWSPDGEFLVLHEARAGSGYDLMLLALKEDGEASPILESEFDELVARISPNGQWMAYISNESGEFQVYVTSFPKPGSRHLISTDGGRQPVWAPNGKELFYRIGDQIMVVDITTDPVFSAATPEVAVQGRYEGPQRVSPSYDITSDGQRFVVVKMDEESVPIHVVLNWFEELKRLVPTDN